MYASATPVRQVGTLSLREVLGLPSGKKTEGTRIEAVLVESFRSPLEMETHRIHERIVGYASVNPLEMVTILLKYYDHEDNRVRKGVRECLNDIFETDEGLGAILENMVHPNRSVRKAVQSFLGERVGAHAVTYASFYEQTMLLASISKKKEIPVQDITSLAQVTKQTFIDGEIMQAVEDIGVCLDFIRHRLRSSEQLRNYVSDMLKMAPDLTKWGAYSGALEESLRKAMKASHRRDFDETSDLVDERIMESLMRNRLYQFGPVIKDNIFERPRNAPEDLRDDDLDQLGQLHDIVDAIASLLIAGQKGEATKTLSKYIENDLFAAYESSLKERIAEKEPSALFTIYNAVVVILKLASSISPIAAEDVYQNNLRHLEGEPSIHIVMWPEAVMGMVSASQSSDGEESPSEARS